MKNSFKTNTIFLSLWAAVSTLIPMVVLCVFSTTNQTGNFTLNNFLKIGTYGHVILKSMLFAATTTIGCLLVSFPVAYIVFKNVKPSNQKILITLIMLPTLTNMILRTFAWMTLLEKFKCCKHGTNAEFYTNGTFYNAELNRLDQYHKRYEHVEKDYWADSINEVKELFGVE